VTTGRAPANFIAILLDNHLPHKNSTAALPPLYPACHGNAGGILRQTAMSPTLLVTLIASHKTEGPHTLPADTCKIAHLACKASVIGVGGDSISLPSQGTGEFRHCLIDGAQWGMRRFCCEKLPLTDVSLLYLARYW